MTTLGAWSLAGLLALAYALYVARLGSLPLQDLPNHVARCTILADLLLHHGARFGGAFEFHFAPVPYLSHDLLLTGLIALLGPDAGGGVFAALVLLSLPAALAFWMRETGIATAARPALLLMSLYLATDFFFLMGFMAFRLAIALILVSLALLERLRRSWSARGYLAYALLLAFGWSVHLTAIVFFLPLLACTTLVRSLVGGAPLRRELLLFAPPLALLGVNSVAMHLFRGVAPPAYGYSWGSPLQKLKDLQYEYERFDGWPARPMFLMMIFCIVWPVRRLLGRIQLLRPEVLELLVAAIAFLGAYVVLPEVYADSTFVDVRALAMVVLCLVLAAARLGAGTEPARGGEAPSPGPAASPPGLAQPLVLAMAALLAIANLGYLALHLGANDRWLEAYRAVAAGITRGAKVLTVNTRRKQKYIAPGLHAGALAVIDRAAISPYLFSGDRGDPMKYFRYRERPYMPGEAWYLSHQAWDKAVTRSFEVEGQWYRWRFAHEPGEYYWSMQDLMPVDWNRIACSYDFLLVSRPYEAARLGTATRLLRANDSAALLAVDRSACRAQDEPSSPVRLPGER